MKDQATARAMALKRLAGSRPPDAEEEQEGDEQGPMTTPQVMTELSELLEGKVTPECLNQVMRLVQQDMGKGGETPEASAAPAAPESEKVSA